MTEFRRGIAGERATAIAGTLLLLAVWYVTNLGYAQLNHGPSRIFLRTPLDEALPVVPAFVVPYVSLNALIALSMLFWLAFRVRLFRVAALAMIVAWLLSYATYILLQSRVDRPVITGNDIFSEAVRSVYAGDNPYNDFPSLHTSLSTITALTWRRFGRWPGRVVTVWVVLIVMSTVLIRQHYLADVLGGLIVAFAGYRVGTRVFDRTNPQPND